MKMIFGLFYGENSHKRIMGIVGFIILTMLMFMSYITIDIYLLALPLLGAFSGLANNDKFKKMGKAMAEQKRTQDKKVEDMEAKLKLLDNPK
jgi:hypothetical protein